MTRNSDITDCITDLIHLNMRHYALRSLCRGSKYVILLLNPKLESNWTGLSMAKPNYAFEKRQREIAKKQKKEEKRKQKAETQQQPAQDDLPETPNAETTNDW